MKAILPNVYYITGLPVGRVYVLEDADGLTLIDATVGGMTPKILAQLQARGHAPQTVKRILITHAHPDHVGSLPELKAATGAQVLASAIEQPVIEGRQMVVRTDPARLRGLIKIRLPETWMKPTLVDRPLQDGDRIEALGGLQVVWSPGHAPGHLAFWQPERRLLFCGDVLFNAPRLGLPPDFLTVDREQNIRSAHLLANLAPAVVCFGHGEPLMQGATEKIQAYVSTVH